MKFMIVLATFVALVHATTKPSIGSLVQHETERLNKLFTASGLDQAEYDMNKLKDVLGKINQWFVQFDTANLSNRIKIKDQIVHEINEANNLADYFTRSFLMNGLDGIHLDESSHASLSSRLESLRAQFKILDQKLSAVKERVKIVIKLTDSATPPAGTFGDDDLLLFVTNASIVRFEENLAKFTEQVEALEAKERPTKEEKDHILGDIDRLVISERKGTKLLTDVVNSKQDDLDVSIKEKFVALLVQLKMLCQEMGELTARVNAIKV